MKTLSALILTAISSTAMTTTVFASEENHGMKHIVSARIQSLNIDRGQPHLMIYDGGSYTIDFTDKKVTLTLTKRTYCPPGARVCPRYMLRPLDITLPLVAKQTNGCGIVTYTAKKDYRMVDGDFKQLEIIDYKNNKCRMMNPSPTIAILTTKFFDRKNGKDTQYVSSFLGDELRLHMMSILPTASE